MSRRSSLSGGESIVSREINDRYTEITIVSDNIDEVAVVAANIDDVIEANGNMSDISTVADEIVPNLPEILLADDNASIATVKASEASNSAGAALASSNSATTSESNAASSEASALASKNAAVISETNASTSETNASASEIAAQNAQAAAEVALDTFDDRYLGAKSSSPSLDNDGDALLDGALYYDTTSKMLHVYDLGTTTWIGLPIQLLSGLTDVTLTSTASGELLMWDGSKWINRTFAELDIALDSQTTTELGLKLDKTGGTITGTLTLEADLIQNGASYETHAEQIFTKNDEVILRDGAVGGLGVGVYTGIRAKLYDGTNDGLLVFGNDGIARVGDEGSLQALATREDTPVDQSLVYWDNATNSFKSSGVLKDDTGTEADFTSALNYN